jgi:glycosyltransferase involved in cell wall biosynthesis
VPPAEQVEQVTPQACGPVDAAPGPPGVLHLVLPGAVRDPGRPSGGNVYDLRLCGELRRAGWTVHELVVAGNWPRPAPAALDRLAAVVATVPTGAPLLVDGLVASAAARVLVPAAARVRLTVLVHLPLGHDTPDARPDEQAVLAAAAAVVTTSGWTRRWLEDAYGLAPERLHRAPPGADPAALTRPDPAGGRLLCVGAVSRTKGQELLVAALAHLANVAGPAAPDWTCTCVGSLDVDPAFADRLRAMVGSAGLTDRVRLLGPRTGAQLDAAYAGADLLVLPSRIETYGMVVTEALARGVPVLATDVGGVTEALLGADEDPRSALPVPGVLVPAEDATALAAALRLWWTDPSWRDRLRRAARAHRDRLAPWAGTAATVAEAVRS